jgi:hypothetical protein
MLLRDAINIPTAVQQGDLVFRLANATSDPEGTLSQYVVTPQLLESFVEASKLVGSAIKDHSSKAAYLSGSFGAGKSNFMGVLQLLLNGEPAALNKAELAPVVAQISEWRDQQKFLTVPFHLIGASSLESAIFGRYVAYVRELHPDAPMPAVFADEPILVNADDLRATMGDDTFFAALSDADGGDGWGDMGGWDLDRYEAARTQPVGDPERQLLVQALLGGLLSAYAAGAKANRDGYVDIESGLAAMSRHAKDLGYSGLILFLDELILWLMSRMADSAFVTEEASKISKLVEANDAERPAPIISFVARQRDLRELIGSDVPGAERLGFFQQLDFQAGRFSDIKLNDSNLVAVAHQRLLQPKDDAAAAALAAAFAGLNLDDFQRTTLRGATGTDDDFRLTYPFSPAFLTVVVDVAGALQRTRTGLRVLLDLLVRNRDTLEVGQLVPIGELFDVLAEADDPLSDTMKQSFESAKRIYRTTLLPMLLETHSLAVDADPTPAFLNDDRIIKTLLLAALVPQSEPLRNMTARKLVALNHRHMSKKMVGDAFSPVIAKLSTWAARTGELQVGGESNNPTVNLVLSQVDTRAILDSVAGVDNPGSRRLLVKDMVAKELGVPVNELLQTTQVAWRGERRSVELTFDNVRDSERLPDASFASPSGGWKVVIDYPFDDEGHTPLEDVARVERLRELGNDWRTICWIPSFFTAEVRKQLGDLVRLDHLFPQPGQASERFAEATRNLSTEAREAARPQLEAQQRAARSRLEQVLKQAYGLGVADPAVVDSSHALADHFPSLLAGFQVRPPVASTLREAFETVVEQALEHTYPGAPAIEGEVRIADLRSVLEMCQQALEQPDHRIPQVPTAERKVMNRIATPLRLGSQYEQAFQLDVTPHWDTHFTRKMAARVQAGAEGHPTVAEFREWIDDPKPTGLSRELKNLVILVWAAATDRTFHDHGGPARVGIDSLPDHLEVVAQDLPDAATWTTACTRAQQLRGVPGLPAEPSAVGLAKLSNALTAAVAEHRDDSDRLVGALGTLSALTGDQRPNRVQTAENAAALLDAIGASGSDLEKVAALVGAQVHHSMEAVGSSIASAAAVVGTIAALDVQIMGAAAAHPDGGFVTSELSELLDAEELAQPLAQPLRDLYSRARTLVLGAQPTPPVPPVDTATGDDATTDVPTDTGVTTAGTTRVPVVSERGLEKKATIKRLKDLRKQIEEGEIEGDEFDLEITAILNQGDE